MIKLIYSFTIPYYYYYYYYYFLERERKRFINKVFIKERGVKNRKVIKVEIALSF
jgi:hypothetical protein